MAKVFRLQCFSLFTTKQVKCVSTFHYAFAPGTNAPLELMDGFMASFSDVGNMYQRLIACATDEMLFRTTRVTYLGFTGQEPIWKEYGTVFIPGDLAGPTLPPQVTVAVKRTSNIAKRWGYGRIYVPGLQTASVSNGEVIALSSLDAALTALAAEQASVYSPVIGGAPVDFTPCLVRVGQVDVDGGPVITKVLSGSYSRITRSQRRREIGVGI